MASRGRVLWHTTVSLDGFIAGPGDAMDWVFRYSDPIPEVDEVIRTTGALLVGRRSYDVGRKPDAPPEARKPFGGAWEGPQFVLTHRRPESAADPGVTFVSGDVRAAVGRALSAAGGKNVVVIGASVARQCLEAGLVDEVLVHIAPVLLGDGVRLFTRQASAPVELETIGVTRAGQIATVRLRVPAAGAGADSAGEARAVADVAEGCIFATVEVAADPQRVFRALASSEIVHWWVRPGVFDTAEWKGNVARGGAWRASGTGSGRPYSLEGEFLEIDPGRKLVHTWRAVGAPAAATIVTYLLEPLEGKTRVTLRHAGFKSREACLNTAIGWETSFERLAGYLAQASE